MNAALPRVAVLLALYEPHLDWLQELFDSLNAQQYPNLYLYMLDDDSESARYAAIQTLAAARLSKISWRLAQNDHNLGSNESFARLTAEAEGDYFAYCDQDDIWMPQKLRTLVALAESAGATMAYSDVSVIDADGRRLAASLRELRPRLRYVQGEGLAETYFFRNCTAGCCMLVRADIAKRALPFPRETLHDHWLAINAAASGSVAFTQEALTAYRQHQDNQTGILSGVDSKADYRRLRVEPLRERMQRCGERFPLSEALLRFVRARLEGDIPTIWKYRALSPYEAKLEVVMKLLPESVFQHILCSARRN